jgi:tetratricopeptide (TPR) repeat protein
VELRPQDPNYEYTLAYFLNQQGKTKEAIEVLEAALSRSPAMGDLYAMLGTLYEMERRLDDAARVYNAGIANNRLALQERAQFQALLQRMRRR